MLAQLLNFYLPACGAWPTGMEGLKISRVSSKQSCSHITMLTLTVI